MIQRSSVRTSSVPTGCWRYVRWADSAAGLLSVPCRACLAVHFPSQLIICLQIVQANGSLYVKAAQFATTIPSVPAPYRRRGI